MKNGFTLIELLAVILILGIIALIAIPTVNQILDEAREGAFRTTSDNIMKAMESSCQTQLIKGIVPTLVYTFIDGEPNSNLEVKGTMPDDGYVFLDNECSVTDYFLRDKNYTYSNGEDIRNDYMLIPSTESNTSMFKILYPSYYQNITTVNFVNHLNIHENAIEIKDPSISGNNKIKSWLIEKDGTYELYIGSEKLIFGNYNSSYLFKDFNKIELVNFNNFNTSFVKNMRAMFNNCTSLLSTNISDWITTHVKDMSYMFCGCQKLQSLNLTNWDTRNLESIQQMFYLGGNNSSFTLDLSKWDTSNIKNYGFQGAFQASGITNLGNISNWDVSNAYSFSNMFQQSKITSLDMSKWKINDSSVVNDMFKGCNNLSNIKLPDANITNKVINSFPSKTAESPGSITIVGDKTGLDTTTLQSKFWNVN